jgi:putative chitinase
MKITSSLLQQATGCSPEAAVKFADHLDEACRTYGIDTPARVSAFLGQISHESGSLRYVEEVWGPTAAQSRYEGRKDLGNVKEGDGSFFRGHGLIQITGRYNHARVRDRLRKRWPTAPDFELTPSALTSPVWAARSAADYWDEHNLNQLADAGDNFGITRRINGGENGLADRLARTKRAVAALAAVATTAGTPPQEIIAHTQPEPPAAAPTKDKEMAPFILAALPALLNAVPALGKLFTDGQGMTDAKKDAIANVAVEAAREALGVRNAQEVAETLESKPDAAKVVQAAVEGRWYEITEIGGGGISAARLADKEFVASGSRFWQSPSFVALCMMLPLVYMIMGAVIGLYGTMTLSAEVTASIITGLVTLIVGAGTGYYFGSTTSKNKPEGITR